MNKFSAFGFLLLVISFYSCTTDYKILESVDSIGLTTDESIKVIGETITFEFIENGPPVTTVEIFNGYMKTEKTWQENGRVKKLKLYLNDKAIAILNLEDVKSLQFKGLVNHLRS